MRTLALPLSLLFLGLGLAGILLGDRRRAPHDLIAGDGRHLLPGRAGSPAAIPIPRLIVHPA